MTRVVDGVSAGVPVALQEHGVPRIQVRVEVKGRQAWRAAGKLHFSVGDMDNFYLNLGVYRMEDFLESTSSPAFAGSFVYGRPMFGHTTYGFDPYPMKLLEVMADHITRNAPAGEATKSWRY